MLYLCYISKGMSVKEVSAMLGYEKHDPIKKELYERLMDSANGASWAQDARAKGAKGCMRFVKIKDIELDDVETWLFTLGLEDSSFIPIGTVEMEGEALYHLLDKEIREIHSSLQPECIDLLVKLLSEDGDREVVARGGWFVDMPYRNRTAVTRHYDKRHAEEVKKIRSKYNTQITQKMNKLDL